MDPELDEGDSYYSTVDRLQWEAWNEANAERAAERERAAGWDHPYLAAEEVPGGDEPPF
jgi:hypothetical protein